MNPKRIFVCLLAGAMALEADWGESVMEIGEKARVLVLKPDLMNGSRVEQNLTIDFKKQRQKHFDAIWEDVIADLEKGLALSRKIELAPDSSYFSADKESLRRELDGVMDDIVTLILDNQTINYRKAIQEANEKIDRLKKDILSYREQKITAPLESTLGTTKGDLEAKIVESKGAIVALEGSIVENKGLMSRDFNAMGINLSPQQIDILLSRVDGDDIIAMTLLMDVLKQITIQLMGIMQESGEELAQAKKYYGMHMVLLDMVVYVQQSLIDKIELGYIPKIDKILSDTDGMLEATKQKIATEEDFSRRSIYLKNLEAQKLTSKVAKIYRKNLSTGLAQIKNAKSVSQKNLDLSKNTYKTVSLSSELVKIISTSQEMMGEVMKLQVPDIVPFDNIEMRDKFEELTIKLKE